MAEQPISITQAKVVTKKKTHLSLVWLIPLVAAGVAAWVTAAKIMSEGPKITIRFKSAEGLEAGKTKVRYNGVDVGTITDIRLADDHKAVVTTAEMAPKTESFFVEDSQMWVVRPRISGANISGLGTLISGAYIGLEIGSSPKQKHDFVALENPPIVTIDAPGRYFVLKTPDLGSLDTGTPLFFRRLQVGQVVSYKLDPDGKTFTVKAFVHAPYDQFVNSDTRFWHASGIDFSLSATGVTVQTQSVLSILIGGIAFETPATGAALQPAEANAEFQLYANRVDAFKPPARDPQTYVLVFKQSVRGLSPGAPVEFRGIPVGEVVEMSAQVDMEAKEFSVPVLIRLDPQRLGVRLEDVGPEGLEPARRKLIDSLVAHGFRAQLRSGSLLTGSLYVTFDAFPNAAPATVDWSRTPVELPTTPSSMEALEGSIVAILNKLEKLPLDQIGSEATKAIADLRITLASATKTLDSADKVIAPNQDLGPDLGATLNEVSRAARSIRVLADYLERHPEALLRGKGNE
jgi:paraquat-inducible protein B